MRLAKFTIGANWLSREVYFGIGRLELGPGNSELWELQAIVATVNKIAQTNPNYHPNSVALTLISIPKGVIQN